MRKIVRQTDVDEWPIEKRTGRTPPRTGHAEDDNGGEGLSNNESAEVEKETDEEGEEAAEAAEGDHQTIEKTEDEWEESEEPVEGNRRTKK